MSIRVNKIDMPCDIFVNLVRDVKFTYMGKEKYYTPSLEEFCIGFECETRVASFEENWKKTTIYAEFKDGWNSNLEELLIAYEDGYLEFRVKYLDQSDIEELGFIFTGKSIDVWFKKDVHETPGGRHKLTHVTLHYNLQDHELKIDCYFGKEHEGCLFEGFIKNKSELKKVLNMLNIK